MLREPTWVIHWEWLVLEHFSGSYFLLSKRIRQQTFINSHYETSNYSASLQKLNNLIQAILLKYYAECIKASILRCSFSHKVGPDSSWWCNHNIEKLSIKSSHSCWYWQPSLPLSQVTREGWAGVHYTQIWSISTVHISTISLCSQFNSHGGPGCQYKHTTDWRESNNIQSGLGVCNYSTARKNRKSRKRESHLTVGCFLSYSRPLFVLLFARMCVTEERGEW